MEVIHNHFNTMHERFSSPLNYNPMHRVYWSMYERDTLFGASHNAFSTPWQSNSQANPEYESSDMEKAIRWAIHSTTMPQPSTTIFVLPKWKYTTYRTWLQHNNVRFSDRAEVKQLHACMQRLTQGMVDHYRAYCVQHGLFCDPQAIHAITRFCMAQCLDRGPFMALQPHQGHYYLAAIDEASI